MSADVAERLLRLSAASPLDKGRSVVRVPRSWLKSEGLTSGEIVEVTAEGDKRTFARVLPGSGGDDGAALDDLLLKTNGFGEGDAVTITKVRTTSARAITVELNNPKSASVLGLKRLIRQHLEHKPITVGQNIAVALVGGRMIGAEITAVSADEDGAAVVSPSTQVSIRSGQAEPRREGIGYEDLGGLEPEIEKVREIVEGPMKHRDLFEKLGISAPRGVLFTGPPGTGKTLLARAVAEETGASFFHIAGPEIASKHFGESERQLREIFQKASAKAPSIIFIDEIDAIAPKRDSLSGEKQVERRMVAQLLTLLDGLEGRGQVVVMAATNLPDSLDGALRRPGRFDREVAFQPPSVGGRAQILGIHSRGMPLADDVDLSEVASSAHGFVGADLAALCREAGMSALRRLLESGENETALAEATIIRADFMKALGDIRPTALRELFTERPDRSFADVGGQDHAKEALEESVVLPLNHCELVEACGVEPASGILLEGPPGTGKTLLAQALAGEAGVNFISVQGSELISQFFGEAEKTVRDLFAKARMASPCIVFIDEIDALAPRRGSDAGVMDRLVGQFLTELDGMQGRKGVILLAATNRTDAIDPALLRPGRIDRIIGVDLPDGPSREQILSVHLRERNLDQDVDTAALAAAAEGFSGADLAALVRRAALASLRRSLLSEEQKPLPITGQELRTALQNIVDDKKRGGNHV